MFKKLLQLISIIKQHILLKIELVMEIQSDILNYKDI
jgi:hypothetical protein